MILLSLFLITGLLSYKEMLSDPQQACKQHSPFTGTSLPAGYNHLFAGSAECLLCHNSMVNGMGVPVGIISGWRSTMMANSAKDPLWQAKVSHEVIVNPGHSDALEDICTRCHAPSGHFDAHYQGSNYYGISEMLTDPLALDGVSCTLCHQVEEEGLGVFSGNLAIGENKEIWGPFSSPFTPPMFNNTGYTPYQGTHIKDSRLCAGCHTLLTNSVDLNGFPTGEHFVEQAIYQEWQNSNFPGDDITCQYCHIPEIPDYVKISSIPPWLDGRSPFGMHHLAGGNAYLQKIFKGNIEDLGLTADPIHFDSTLSRIETMLKKNTLEVTLTETGRDSDSIHLKLHLQNLAGHKFPTGFPSRRAFVEIIIRNGEGDTLFHNGKTGPDFSIIGEDRPYEAHHNVIRNEDEVQIYEMLMGDVNGNLTTVLERGFFHLKDNRLPPAGFTSGHSSYDTVEIAGNALADENFNKQNGLEGSGSDDIYIHAFTGGYSGTLIVAARVNYQTVNGRWLEEMFEHSSPEIDLWKGLFLDSDRQPVIIREDSLTSFATNMIEPEKTGFTVYPNPTSGFLYFQSSEIFLDCSIYNFRGECLGKQELQPGNQALSTATLDPGIYIIRMLSERGTSYSRKMVVY